MYKKNPFISQNPHPPSLHHFFNGPSLSFFYYFLLPVNNLWWLNADWITDWIIRLLFIDDIWDVFGFVFFGLIFVFKEIPGGSGLSVAIPGYSGSVPGLVFRACSTFTDIHPTPGERLKNA